MLVCTEDKQDSHSNTQARPMSLWKWYTAIYVDLYDQCQSVEQDISLHSSTIIADIQCATSLKRRMDGSLWMHSSSTRPGLRTKREGVSRLYAPMVVVNM